MDQQDPQHVGVSVFCDIIVNQIELCAVVGLNCAS